MRRHISTRATAGPKTWFGSPPALLFRGDCRRRRRGWSVSGLWRESRNCRIIGNVPLCTCLWKKLLAPMTTNDWPMVDVLRVKALDGHRLWVRFSDGNEGVRDFSDIIATGGPMVEPLKAPAYFARA